MRPGGCLANLAPGNGTLVRISVFGTGYLGATHAAALAAWGHDVVGVDVDPRRVRELSAGVAPFHEPDFADLLTEGLRSRRLVFTTDPAAARGAAVHFVCVGTPQTDGGGAADLSALWATIEALAPHLSPADLVVGKST